VRRARLAPAMISTPGHRASRRRQREALPAWRDFLGSRLDLPPIKPVYEPPSAPCIFRRATGQQDATPAPVSANNEWYCGLRSLPRRGTGSSNPFLSSPESTAKSVQTSVVAPITSHRSSGSRRDAKAVEPTRQNMTVSCRRSAVSVRAGSGTGLPDWNGFADRLAATAIELSGQLLLETAGRAGRRQSTTALSAKAPGCGVFPPCSLGRAFDAPRAKRPYLAYSEVGTV
jgi:hypothetical protein